MGIKRFPFVQLIVFPLDAGTPNGPRAAAVADVVSQLGQPSANRANPTVPREEPGTKVNYMSGLRQWDLADEQTGTRTAGYTLKPEVQPLHAIMDGATEPDDDYEVLAFTAVQGDYWTTVTPGYAPHTTAIKWYDSSAPGQYFMARSVEKLGAAQSFAFQLHTFGMVDTDAYLCVQWGGGYGVYLAANEPATLIQGDSKQHNTLRTLDLPPETFFAGEPAWVYVHYIAGRLVLEIAKGDARTQVVYAHQRTSVNPNDTTGNMDTLEMRTIDAAPGYLQVYGQGAPFTLRINELQYPATGRFERGYNLQRETQDDEPDVAVAFGTNPYGANTSGRSTAGLEGVADVVARQTDEGFASTSHAYTCTLSRAQGYTGGCMSEHHTPFVHGVVVRYPSTWDDLRNDGMLLTPALLDLTVDIADPTLAPGTVVNATLRRDLLPSCPTIDDAGIEGAVVGSDWPDYLAKYHQCKLILGWYSESGGVLSVEAADTWCVLDGYVWTVDHQLPGFGENVMQVEFRDPIVRLQAPAGIIDSRFGPGDAVLFNKVALNGQPQLYGRELVAYILGVVLGDAWAAQLQVSNSLQAGSGHYDLVTYKMLTEAPFGGGFYYPPPWGQSALDWIKTIAETDYAVFYFRPNSAAQTGPPQPVYAYYWDVIDHGFAVELNDAVVDAEDVDLLIQEASIQAHPEVDYNVVAVWGHPPQDQGDYRSLMPSLPDISGLAWVVNPSYPEQDPHMTWERMLLKEGTQFWQKRVARVIAFNLARLLTGVDPRRFPITLAKGDAQFWWGDKVRLSTSVIPGNDMRDADFLDPTEVVRVMRVRHRVDMNARNWTTTLTAVSEADPL